MDPNANDEELACSWDWHDRPRRWWMSGHMSRGGLGSWPRYGKPREPVRRREQAAIGVGDPHLQIVVKW